jgi:hypothetical protein
MSGSNCSTLAGLFKRIPDPRKERQERHQWHFLLTLIGTRVARRQKTARAIARWI